MIPGSANPLLLKSAAAAAGGLQISRSIRLNSADSAYFSRTPAVAGNRRTWTWSGWVKRSALGVNAALFGRQQSDDTNTLDIRFGPGDTLRLANFNSYLLETTQVFRDTSAWFHLVLALDTTQATANNRARMYVNGVEVTQFGARTNPTQNADLAINSTTLHHLGATVSGGGATYYFPGYLTNIHFIDGQALDPSSFTETDATTGQLIPKTYTGSYGTNGFNLLFADNSAATATTLGKDSAGSNNWTPNNLSVTAGAGNDSLVDSPTNYGTDTGVGGEVRGNYCTWNPLINGDTAANGNLDVTNDTARGTHKLLDYNAYWEITSIGGTTTAGVVSDGGTTNTTTIANGKTYGFKLSTAGALEYINITDSGSFTSITTGLTGIRFPYASAAASTTGSLNAGQRAFAYTAPSGFKALCTTNLPAPLVTKSNTVMDVITYTGTGSSLTLPNGSSTPTSIAFTPDFVWLKGRSGATDHAIYDSVRDVQKDLVSNSTAAETTQTTGLTAFGTNTFTVGSLAKLNTSSATYVGWAWDAGTSTVSNTQGSITSQVRANASAGFSVVTFTGAGGSQTVGHGLGVTPSLVIAKNRASTNSWAVWFTGFTANEYLNFNSTAAKSTFSTQWGSTPTSTVIGVADSSVNGNGNGIVAYCFAPVIGYSNGFSYTGNGSADGSFVYLGFRPRLIMLKRSDSTSNWTLLDTSREGYNVDNDPLYPNLVTAEPTTDLLDITSNGFKLRTTDASVNASAGTYIGFAWAEMPFNYSRAR